MADIKVTPELLSQKANDIRKLVEEHESVMGNIGSLIKGLDDIWTGEAQAALIERFDSMSNTFTQFRDTLEKYAIMIDETVADFTQKDHERAAKNRG